MFAKIKYNVVDVCKRANFSSFDVPFNTKLSIFFSWKLCQMQTNPSPPPCLLKYIFYCVFFILTIPQKKSVAFLCIFRNIVLLCIAQATKSQNSIFRLSSFWSISLASSGISISEKSIEKNLTLFQCTYLNLSFIFKGQ